jgi:deazaflavin-dependent oxidoreductase (nitroreductase family)
MPLPRALGRFNRHVTNRVLGPVVARLPGFGRVVHRGRRSGREYRTPVLAFRRHERMTIAVTYGRQADWLRNVLAVGRCRFETRSATLELVEPRLYRDPSRRAVPWFVRIALAALRADDFLELRVRGPDRDQVSRQLQR